MNASFEFSEVAKARYRYHQTGDDKYFDAVCLWWDLNSQEDRYNYLVAVIDQAPREDLDYLGGIGSGPLEDFRDIHILEFISHLRDRGIARNSIFDEKLCIALQMFRVQPHGEPMTEAEKTIIRYHCCPIV